MSFIMNCFASDRDFMRFSVNCAIYHLCNGVHAEQQKDIQREVAKIPEGIDLYEVLDLTVPLAKRTEKAYLRIALLQAIHKIPHQQRAIVVKECSDGTVGILDLLVKLKLEPLCR